MERRRISNLVLHFQRLCLKSASNQNILARREIAQRAKFLSQDEPRDLASAKSRQSPLSSLSKKRALNAVPRMELL